MDERLLALWCQRILRFHFRPLGDGAGGAGAQRLWRRLLRRCMWGKGAEIREAVVKKGVVREGLVL